MGICNCAVVGYYLVATLLTNILICIRARNIISQQYNCPPPTLEEYFEGYIHPYILEADLVQLKNGQTPIIQDEQD